MKKLVLLSVFLFSLSFLSAQKIEEMATISLEKMKPTYKELENANVHIRYRNRGSAMAASYAWWSVFRRPNKRKYFVIINKNVSNNFMCFQFDHLTAPARDGVMAHELAHIDFFHSLTFFGFIKFVLNQGLPNGLKKSERATDYRTIENGNGKLLKNWSQETRDNFAEGSDEPLPIKFSSRYYTPAEIDSVMKLMPDLY
jgi:hypothetical protein